MKKISTFQYQFSFCSFFNVNLFSLLWQAMNLAQQGLSKVAENGVQGQ
jgi:hypothetical protein